MSTEEGRKTDRRIVRTRAAIQEAFFRLLTTTRYEKITITALANEANIDRKTFYTHYGSIDELLKDQMRAQMDHMFDSASPHDLLSDPVSYTKRLLLPSRNALLSSQEDRRRIFENLPENKLVHAWISAGKERITRELESFPWSTTTKSRMGALLDFYLGGIFNAYTSWLKSDSDLSFEELVDLLSEGIVNGLTGMLSRHTMP